VLRLFFTGATMDTVTQAVSVSRLARFFSSSNAPPVLAARIKSARGEVHNAGLFRTKQP